MMVHMVDPSHDTITFEYNQITDQIWIGTNLCCRTHFDESLTSAGITAEVSLEGEEVDAPFGVKFFAWIPIANHHPPTQDQLDEGVAVLAKLIALGKKIYVHCKHGHGRAPTLVAAYFISTGMSVEEAVEAIRKKRQSIHLEDSQIAALEEFQKRRRSL